MAYVYRHIRIDKNQPFYIGIGSDSDGEYLRAFNKQGRNIHWKRIVGIAGYEVEILFDDLTWSVACLKEKEFIKIYGRRDIGTGVLCNRTDGGDGAINTCHESRERSKDASRRKVCQYSLRGKFIKLHKSVIDAAKEFNTAPPAVGNCALGKSKSCAGYVFRFYEDNTNDIDTSKIKFNYKNYPINQYDLTGKFIATFNSLIEACNVTGLWRGSIGACVRGEYNCAGGFIFKKNMPNNENIYVDKDFRKEHLFKKVFQLSLDGKLINTFKSRIAAESVTGVRSGCISSVCRGKQKTAGGYVWKNTH